MGSASTAPAAGFACKDLAHDEPPLMQAFSIHLLVLPRCRQRIFWYTIEHACQLHCYVPADSGIACKGWKKT